MSDTMAPLITISSCAPGLWTWHCDCGDEQAILHNDEHTARSAVLHGDRHGSYRVVRVLRLLGDHVAPESLLDIIRDNPANALRRN